MNGIRKPARTMTGITIFLFFIIAAGRAADHEARAHYTPGQHNVRHAINLAWCGKSNTYCEDGAEAWQVAGCETGRTYNVYAKSRNGLWWGLWQQGAYSRGFGNWKWNAWAQADSAARAWRANGSCWTCAQQWPTCGRGLDG
jgi:hypothetical protein